MTAFWKSRFFIIPIASFILILSISLVLYRIYVNRPPVLILSDSSFSTLYGEKRINQSRNLLSIKLFRRIFHVIISEGAGVEQIAIAVEDSYENPEVVFFPFRHLNGARYYSERNPEVPVYIIAGANQNPREEIDIPYIRTDLLLDLYRAGLSAAIIAGEDAVMLVHDGTFTDEQLEAFREGVETGGNLHDAKLVQSYISSTLLEDVGCVVLTSPVVGYFEDNYSIPVVLFSWLDPSLTPLSVKVIFDDAPLTLLNQAYKSLPSNGEDVYASSKPIIFKERYDDKTIFRKIRDSLKWKLENPEKNQP